MIKFICKNCHKKYNGSPKAKTPQEAEAMSYRLGMWKMNYEPSQRT